MPEFLYNQKLYYNPVEFVMDRIGGTWKMPILWRQGPYGSAFPPRSNSALRRSCHWKQLLS